MSKKLYLFIHRKIVPSFPSDFKMDGPTCEESMEHELGHASVSGKPNSLHL